MRVKVVLLSIIIETFILTVTAQINLAPRGVAVQITTYSIFTANLAIEGPANNNWDDGCSATDVEQTYAWWGLQLPAVAHMTNILIYYRRNTPYRMNEFSLYLENGTADQRSDLGLCYSDKGKPGYPAVTQNITCNMLAKNMYFVNSRSDATCFIELCYVAIYGCYKGTWGNNCTADCPDECIDRHCFPNNGSCVWGCDAQMCFHGECDSKTDLCTKGCVAGRGGRYCTFYNVVFDRTTKQSLSGLSSAANALTDGNITSCISILSTSSNSYIQIGNESLIVITGVYLFFEDTSPPNGIHKVYCSNTSDSWADGIVLYNAEYHNNDTDVFAVCKYIIYIPPILYGNSNIDLCEIEIGGCPYGKYGDSCKLTCPENCIGLCDLDTGKCLLGCTVGWRGGKCDRECASGYFGFNCAYLCETCLNQSCDIFEGNCRVGCNHEYSGRKCDTPVSAESLTLIKFSFFMGGFASMLGIILIILTVVIARRRIMKKQESRKRIDNSHSNSNEQHYDDIMKMESVSTYQDLSKQTVTVSSDYDQINNAYTNQ